MAARLLYNNLSLFQLVTVSVPFIFKHAVDFLNHPENWLNMADPGSTILTSATAILIACMIIMGGFMQIHKHNVFESLFEKHLS